MLDPCFDLRSEPQSRPVGAEVDDGAGHVRILVQVLADGVPVGEADESGDLLCVDEVFGTNQRHLRERSYSR
jgi:hypothetical protein